MKVKISLFLLMLCMGTLARPERSVAQEVSFQVFYDELSPYGTWVYNTDYGYVWMPDVDPGFTPYATNGHWVFTEEGWTWFSDYSWGWAPFHYGRWYTDATYGPVWVPDNEWGPGWVTWRRSSDYYGWAPIGPGVSINIAYSNGYRLPDNQWTFVRGRDFGRPNINNYYINNSNNVTIIHNTTVINNIRVNKTRNIRYNGGPNRTEVERYGGRRIATITIRESRRPGQNLGQGQLEIYRPRVERNGPGGAKPAPRKVVSIKEVKTTVQRTTERRVEKTNQTVKEAPRQQPAQQHTGNNRPRETQHAAQPQKQRSNVQPQQVTEREKQAQPARQMQQRPDRQQTQQQQRAPVQNKAGRNQEQRPQPEKQKQQNQRLDRPAHQPKQKGGGNPPADGKGNKDENSHPQ